MADTEPRKRSRFDQKEPEPKRTSRFDRRSRSPSNRVSETRERSPVSKTDSAVDPAAAAAAAAAKINAQLQARKGIQHVDVPPILGATSNGAPDASADSTAPEGGKGAPGAPGEMYVSDGDYIQDIEVNDLRNRYMLMKAQTQQSIQKETGADLTVRGKYYPNKSMATAAEPPLYLHITARTKEVLEAAVAKVNELIEQELPQLVDERRFKRREREQPEGEENSRRNKWPEESIPVGLEPIPGFNLRAQIVGAGGSYVKHIQTETGCRVQIKGRGSGYIERDTNQESEEEMFLHVAGPDQAMVEKGRDLCKDLIENVREQYEDFKSRPPRHHGDRGGYSDRGYGGDRYGGDRGYGGDRRGGYNDRGGDHYSGRGGGGDSYPGYGRQNSDSGSRGAATGTDSPANADYNAQYAQYYAQAAANGEDPYAAYGGYANYVALYQQYYTQYAQGQTGAAQSPTQVSGAAPAAPAPPPPSDSAPPPPPPPTSAAPPPPPPSASPPGAPGGYSAVPPPPGL
ncbi:KH domain protein [Cordyceps fumosorosea ARSEF 2679]|uniref:KH domain protein n=1 Tax=Cordyceps fumosorosea (strain ARSEF 2679) TaxID=1081104 RepID=A0A168CBM4_CORFA|nr:KH domain protein [Cordyceps fumosorosea ARSEF 2679]OAA71191.1 KH domain protein [Cordyceps fumosorosea ARSEF 2679]